MIDDVRDDRQAKIEQALRDHPGVSAAMVVVHPSRSSGPRVTAYVVPHPAYVDGALVDEADVNRRLEQWRTVYDWFQKSKNGGADDLGLDTSIWTSSYTRQPIPADDMREWVELTVAAILSHSPREVLEIGCGTGPLLLRVAPRCVRYVGTDFSALSLRRVERRVHELGGDSWRNVTLLERRADDFSGLSAGSFDAVVMNSVLQCFPNIAYGERVLAGILDALKPGGTAFIGDVPNAALLPAFAVSVELFHASDDLSVAEVKRRVRRRLEHERELVISPAWFVEFAQRHPEISRVAIRPKLGRSDNEMMAFRYDVFLERSSKTHPLVEVPWLDWEARELSIDVVRDLLLTDRPATLAIAAVPNARVARDVAALIYLRGADDETLTVADLKRELRARPCPGEHPHRWLPLADECGYTAELSWASGHEDGRYDVLFTNHEEARRRTDAPRIAWPRPAKAFDPARSVSDPTRLARTRALVRQLQDYLESRLPEQDRPADLVPRTVLPPSEAAARRLFPSDFIPDC